MRIVGVLMMACAIGGCCKRRDNGAGGSPIGADPTVNAQAPGVAPTWDTPSVPLVVDRCSDAKAVLAVVTNEVYSKPGFEWKWARQVMLANPQLTVVPHAALMPGQVAFQDYDYGSSGAKALVANCGHGGTCNQVAMAYKAIVRSSKPHVYCGKVPGLGIAASGVPMWLEGGSRANLPQNGDTISQCARLAACTLVKDPSTPGDPGLECQRSPSRFQLGCARKATCSDVVACAGR